jgi:large subunit ribosomal protein L5
VSILKEKYNGFRESLKKELGIDNDMQVPRIQKVVINIACGRDAVANSKVVNMAVEELEKITGQKAQIAKAKKSIANFKLREGMPIGCFVTLRRERMWSFLDRLNTVALPRVRDFKGISSRAFDGRGNYNLGLKEQIVFPEINYDKVDKLRGMNISICTNAKNDKDARALLTALGLPFRK